MSIQTVAHINLRDEARPAVSFYQSVFGGDLVLLTHAQINDPTDPAEADLVSWGRVVSKEGFAIRAYDAPAGWSPLMECSRADSASLGFSTCNAATPIERPATRS